jgi:hypothetical protein
VDAFAVLNGRDPLALDRPGHERHGLLGRGPRLGIGLVDQPQVVAVDVDRVPAEGADPGRERARVAAGHGGAALPLAVGVDDRDQVAETVVAGAFERLPHRPLGQLTVAAQHPDPRRAPPEPGPQGHADRHRQALAERPGGHVHPGQARRRVPFEPAARPAEGEQLVVGDGPGRLEHSVQQRSGVALGEDEAVVAGMGWAGEVVAQVAAQQHGHEVGGRQRRGRVAGAGGGGGPDHVDPELPGQILPLLADHAPTSKPAHPRRDGHAARRWARASADSPAERPWLPKARRVARTRRWRRTA